MYKLVLFTSALVLLATSTKALAGCANDSCAVTHVEWSDCMRLKKGVACTIEKGVSYRVVVPVGTLIFSRCREIYEDCWRCRAGQYVRDFKHTGGGVLTGSDS